MEISEQIKCAKCLQLRPIEDFPVNKRSKSGYSTFCVDCKAVRSADAIRGSSLRLRYGLSLEEYDEILVTQGGVCWICKKPCVTGRRLAVDHDHVTGEIRGLLCYKCNKLLVGNHDLETLKLIVKYLENPPVRQMYGGISRYVPEGKEKPRKNRRRKKRAISNRRKH